jgi:hypothetical protein
MSNPSQDLWISVSPELRQRLEAYQANQGIASLSNAIAQILTDYFGLPKTVETPTTLHRLETLERQVASLTQQLESFNQIILQTSPSHATTHSRSPVTTSFVADDDDDDDMYDEPDEILFDFLQPE